jgi:hypothetical protein
MEVPPVEWFLKTDSYTVGKLKDGTLKDGTLLVADRWSDDEEAGCVIRWHKNFEALCDSGNYASQVLLALAHKLGIKKRRATFAEKLWYPVERIFSGEEPNTPQEYIKFYEGWLKLLSSDAYLRDYAKTAKARISVEKEKAWFVAKIEKLRKSVLKAQEVTA